MRLLLTIGLASGVLAWQSPYRACATPERGKVPQSFTCPWASEQTCPSPRAGVIQCSQLSIDSKLLVADTTLVFAFSFARTLANILVSPDFEGWLAPVNADPVKLAATVGFAGAWSAAWCIAGVLLNTFDPGVSEESIRRVGPRGATSCFALAFAFWCIPSLVAIATGDAMTVPLPQELCLSVENVEAALGIGIGLIAWRALLADVASFR